MNEANNARIAELATAIMDHTKFNTLSVPASDIHLLAYQIGMLVTAEEPMDRDIAKIVSENWEKYSDSPLAPDVPK